MSDLRRSLVPLLAVLLASSVCPAVASPDPGSAEPSDSNHRIVESRWPDGTLRERRQVLRLADGTTVDDGPFERWFADGTKEYEAAFVRGRKEGETVRYHRNGRVASRQHYRDGQRHGASVSWDEDGAKVKEEHWTEGRPDGTWTVWEDGKITWMHTFDRGDPDPATTPERGTEDEPYDSRIGGGPVPVAGDAASGRNRRGQEAGPGRPPRTAS